MSLLVDGVKPFFVTCFISNAPIIKTSGSKLSCKCTFFPWWVDYLLKNQGRCTWIMHMIRIWSLQILFLLNQLLVIKFEIISGICQLVKLTPYELFSSALLKEITCSHSIQINTCRNTVIIFFILFEFFEFFFVYCANRVNNYRLLQV